MCKYNFYEKITTKHPKGTYGFDSGWGTDNNGFAKSGAEVEKLLVTPNVRQMSFLEMEYYNFIHFGVNTMTGREWGTGKEDPQIFDPVDLDTDKWCEILKASGSKGVILTAKHHDGFCLWPSAYTEHSLKNSPYKGGKGDIVKDLSESCKKYGLKLGLYLSPWDMHEPTFGTKDYSQFFINQLTELCTNYGELFCFWFDGACGTKTDHDFKYDYDVWFGIIERYQPNAVTSIMGRDVRWVGNEAGVSRESEFSISGNYQQLFQNSPDDAQRLQKVDASSLPDLGSRKALAKFSADQLSFKPAEVDVSLRLGWFYHKYQFPRTLKRLLHIYYKSVGGNSSLLLNIPPDNKGVIDQRDVLRLKEFADSINATTKNQIFPVSAKVGTCANGTVKMKDDALLSNLFTDDRGTYYELSDENYIVDFDFGKQVSINRMDLRESLQFSQRIEKFEVWAKDGSGWKLVGDNTVIGNRKIFMFKDAVKTDCIRLVIKQSRSNPYLRSIQFYAGS